MNTNSATYCPEDNKLRLYVGRVPRPEYDALRAEGWTATPKQDCDFAATWTPARAARCLEYADLIEDEDQTPEERAADRAERFGEYRDKRHAEATGHADTYDAGPSAHGFQSQARAERAAARHDLHAGRACDAWGKAEYWQRRTAGVISHALHKSTPAVRMGRIKEIEADLRRIEKSLSEYAEKWTHWKAISEMTNPEAQTKKALALAYYDNGGEYTHPRTGRKSYLYSFTKDEETDPLNGAELAALWLKSWPEPREETAWTVHLKLRLSYELQMMEAQGGRAAFVEMEPGGWIGSFQIQKVNKSTATGRTVSVNILSPTRNNFDRQGNAYGPENPHPLTVHTLTVERLPANAYRPPTDEERAAFAQEKKARKAAAPKAPACPLVNPTDEEAERLQEILNAAALADHCARHLRSYRKDYAETFKPSTVCRITQANYSAVSKGAYARAETRGLCKAGELEERASNMWCAAAKARAEKRGPALCQIRTTGSDGSDYGARRVIILTDKPQKALPAGVWPVPVVADPEPIAQPAERGFVLVEAAAAPLAQAYLGF